MSFISVNIVQVLQLRRLKKHSIEKFKNKNKKIMAVIGLNLFDNNYFTIRVQKIVISIILLNIECFGSNFHYNSGY